ncbi:hypothetical protein SEPCBS57363_002178 [Sporothrix epigloea]|uniref:Uncharacterized protein n=1 Tax=Sporothrix epigloea TaxID=1892477 RepID=A0ABP0DHP7_9PEZI
MLWKAIVVALVLATQAHVGADAVVEKQSTKAAKTTETRVTRVTTTGAAVGTSETLKTDTKINMTAWDHDATIACHAALAKLPRSSNPSGRCICYNLPMLNNSTGKFEADLRLYQLSVPWGEFEGISPEDVHVSFKYNGASVSPVSAASAANLVVRDDSSSNNATLQFLHRYLFAGQIKKEMMTTDMTIARLQTLVMPVVTLTGTDSTGSTVATNVSLNEAAFVAGVFSTSVVMSNSTRAQAAVDDVVNGLHKGTVAFVLPGVQILLFPIGLIIVSVWLAIGLAFIGFGMVERVSYRNQYRQQVIMSTKPIPNRI